MEGNVTTFGSIITYTCTEPGTRFLDGYQTKVVTCEGNGNWNETVSDCEVGRCQPIPYISNATPNNTTSTIHDTWVVFTCRYGYSYSDGTMYKSIYCQSPQLNWIYYDEFRQGCSPIHCSAVPSISNAVPSTNETTVNTTVTYNCTEGYVYSSGVELIEIVCMENGRWLYRQNITNYDCQPVQCMVSPIIENATYSGNENTFGSFLTYHCFDEYWFARGIYTAITTCGANGHWTPQFAGCQAVLCPSLPVWENAVFSSLSTTPQSRVSYACQKGYRLTNGNVASSSVCQPNGMWMPSIQDCTPNVSPIVLPTVDAANAQIYGAIFAVMTSFVIVALLIVDVIGFYREFFEDRRSGKPRRYPSKKKKKKKSNKRNKKFDSDRTHLFHCSEEEEEEVAEQEQELLASISSRPIQLRSDSTSDGVGANYSPTAADTETLVHQNTQEIPIANSQPSRDERPRVHFAPSTVEAAAAKPTSYVLQSMTEAPESGGGSDKMTTGDVRIVREWKGRRSID